MGGFQRRGDASAALTRAPLVVLANVQWPRFGLGAGGAVHALEVARRIAKEQPVVVVIPSFVAAQARHEYPELEFVVTPVPRALQRSTIAVQLLCAVNWLSCRTLLAGARAAIATSHFLGDVLPLLAAPAVPAIVIVHHLVEPPWKRRGNPWTNALHYLAERASLALIAFRADAVVVDSHASAARLRAAGFRQPISLTVNAPRGVPVTAPLERDGTTVLFVGRLSPTKGLEHLLRAWALVAARAQNARLIIAGGGDEGYVARLAAMASSMAGGASITFAGRVDEDRKRELLAKASVFAFPSEEEGFGIAIVEAMLAGIPCVTFDEPLFDELFPAGRISAPRGDSQAFAEAIVSLLADPQRREALARSGQVACAQYNWERATRLDIEAVERAIEERTARAKAKGCRHRRS